MEKWPLNQNEASAILETEEHNPQQVQVNTVSFCLEQISNLEYDYGNIAPNLDKYVKKVLMEGNVSEKLELFVMIEDIVLNLDSAEDMIIEDHFSSVEYQLYKKHKPKKSNKYDGYPDLVIPKDEQYKQLDPVRFSGDVALYGNYLEYQELKRKLYDLFLGDDDSDNAVIYDTKKRVRGYLLKHIQRGAHNLLEKDKKMVFSDEETALLAEEKKNGLYEHGGFHLVYSFDEYYPKQIAKDYYIFDKKNRHGDTETFIAPHTEEKEKLFEEIDREYDSRLARFEESNARKKIFDARDILNKKEEIKKGHQVKVTDVFKGDSSQLRDRLLLIASLDPFFRKTLRIDTDQFTLREKMSFYEFLFEKTKGQFDRVKQTAEKVGQIDFWRSFLSLEHGGKEMGGTIIALGDKLQEQEAQKIFTGYAQLVDASARMEGVLQAVFQEEKEQSVKTIPFQIQDALMLRAKDILVGALKVVEQEGGDKLKVPDVLAALEGIRTVVDILSDIHDKKEFRFEKQNLPEKNLFKYNVQDKNGYEYGLKVFVRPIAEKNAQARVNIELSFDTNNPNPLLQKAFQNEVISHTQNKRVNSSVLRIGLDRESYGGTESVSLDIGRSERSDGELTRSGDVLGNLLALASTEGHHTTSPFDKNLAKEDVFALLATKLSNYLQSQDVA